VNPNSGLGSTMPLDLETQALFTQGGVGRKEPVPAGNGEVIYNIEFG